MRRRRAEARRQEGRRRLRRLLWGLAAVATVAGAVLVAHSPVLAVRRVLVEGAVRTPKAAVLAAAGFGPGHPSVPMVDVGRPAEVSAVEALPWVGSVTFHRNWPWSVVVRVQERRPAALVSGRQGTDVVDATGRVLEVLGTSRLSSGVASLPPLPVLKGAVEAPAGQRIGPAAGQSPWALRALEMAAARVPAVLAGRGLSLRYAGRKGLEARLGAGGATVVLGSPAQMGTKLAVLAELVRHTSLSGYSLVDLTVPMHPALDPVGMTGANGGNG